MVIVVYDIKENESDKLKKVCRKHLRHIQNSVFEGDLSPAQINNLKSDLNKIMKEVSGTVKLYEFPSDLLKIDFFGNAGVSASDTII